MLQSAAQGCKGDRARTSQVTRAPKLTVSASGLTQDARQDGRRQQSPPSSEGDLGSQVLIPREAEAASVLWLS